MDYSLGYFSDFGKPNLDLLNKFIVLLLFIRVIAVIRLLLTD